MSLPAGRTMTSTVVEEPRLRVDPALRARVDACLRDFVGQRAAELLAVGRQLSPVTDAVGAAVQGGKRLRAAFCHLGWLGAGGADEPGDEALVRAATALELFHVAALVHDDVMDRSDTRRGRRTVHRTFAELHRQGGLVGDAGAHGDAVAVLVGDLCLTWSDALMDDALRVRSDAGHPEHARAARDVFHLMRTQVMAGQYLDVLEQAQHRTDPSAAHTVAQYKSAKYTVEHPLVLGGALAGASPDLLAQYAAFGLPVGEAFQLRDDVLGVFGDTTHTGKPSGDDLREGKKTVLVALAQERADRSQRLTLRRHLGRPDLSAPGLRALRAVLVDTGALAEVEARIEGLTSSALGRLDEAALPPGTRDALAGLARGCAWRSA